MNKYQNILLETCVILKRAHSTTLQTKTSEYVVLTFDNYNSQSFKFTQGAKRHCSPDTRVAYPIFELKSNSDGMSEKFAFSLTCEWIISTCSVSLLMLAEKSLFIAKFLLWMMWRRRCCNLPLITSNPLNPTHINFTVITNSICFWICYSITTTLFN